MKYKYDFLIIGAGVAGMSYALKIARAKKGKVCIICKTALDEANTSFAQGGVASVTNLVVDNFEKHIEDTMIAGDFISDRAAVEQVVRMAPSQIKELVEWGVNFDKKEDGTFDLHREGGHSEFRILHHADDTGAEIQRGLIAAVRANPDIEVKEHHFAVEIITQHHLGVTVTRRNKDIKCYGAYVLNPETQKVDTYLSKVTLMCTGGCGAVYQTTTNPIIATGDGEAMVYRAKGTVADMEFVQFHPTALFHPGETHPAFLITEAMRGYGGILRLPNGETFMEKYDDRLSLAPRDIVARAIDKEMKIHGLDHVCLDVTHKPAEETRKHFPNIYHKCLTIGIDITTDYIPVRPAAHYMCGGIKVDLNGCSSISRLYAIGECSCTGLHGGNRLASNSLIEAVVYAETAARHSLAPVDEYDFNTLVPEWNDEGTMTNEEKVLITEAMRGYGGILRLPNGETFMEKYDERLSLAPRDIVARAIDKEMKIHGLDHVCLDVTHKPAEETRKHFPNIYHKCLTIGIDITTDYIPVRPAAHYMCGGIKVDLNGCSSISRLYAIGECSCTGLHGGNRLASNSLIEAVVYAETAARHSLAHVDEYDFNTLVPEWNDEGTMTNEEKVLITQSVKEVGEIMANYVGIVRSNLRLQRAWTRLDVLYEETEKLFKRVKATRDICELRNMINTAYLITRWAIERKECRGLHYTTDYPHK